MTLRHGATLHAELERLWSTLAGHKNNVIHMVDFLVDKGLEESMPDRVRHSLKTLTPLPNPACCVTWLLVFKHAVYCVGVGVQACCFTAWVLAFKHAVSQRGC